MRNVKLVIEFDGTGYSGWMRQGKKPGISTVQSVLEDAVEKLTGERVTIIGCSRTDAGVHALNYVANFSTESTIPSENLYRALKPASAAGHQGEVLRDGGGSFSRRLFGKK